MRRSIVVVLIAAAGWIMLVPGTLAAASTSSTVGPVRALEQLSPLLQVTTTAEITAVLPPGAPVPTRLNFEPADRVVQLRLSADSTHYRGRLTIAAPVTTSQPVTNVRWLNVTELSPIGMIAPVVDAAEITITPAGPLTLGPGELRQYLIVAPKPALPGVYRGTATVMTGEGVGQSATLIEFELTAPSPVLNIDTRAAILIADEAGVYRGSFSLWAAATSITKLAFTPGLLTSADATSLVTATAVTVQPGAAVLDMGDAPTPFSISVSPVSAGTYSGTLLITYYGDSAIKARGIATLTLRLAADPQASVALSFTDKVQLAVQAGEYLTPTIYLRETGNVNAARNVTLTAGGLVDPAHNRTLPDAVVLPGVPITIPRAQTRSTVLPLALVSAEPGSYTGTLQISGDNLATTYVPLEITIKDPLAGPLFVLLIGVVLGFYLTWYGGAYRDHDKQLVMIDFRKRMLQDNRASAYYAFYGETAAKQLDTARQLVEDDWPGNQAKVTDVLKTVRGYSTIWANHHLVLEAQRARIVAWIKAYGATTEYAFFGAMRDRLADIDAKRHTYADGDSLTKAVDDALADWLKFDALIERVKQFTPQFSAVVATLEAAPAADCLKRFAALTDRLKAARSGADLTALETDLTTLGNDLLVAYAAYPQFYYDACLDDVYKWLNSSDGADGFDPQWPAVKSKLAAILEEAKNHIKARANFERASLLTYKVWRAAWFYRFVLRPMFEAAHAVQSPADPWTAAITKAREIETWVITTNYAAGTRDEFDQDLLGDRTLAELYRLWSTAQGTTISSPTPPPAPIKPVRLQLATASEAAREMTPKSPGALSPDRAVGGGWLDQLMSSLTALPGLSALTTVGDLGEDLSGASTPIVQRIQVSLRRFGAAVWARVKSVTQVVWRIITNPWLRWSSFEFVITALSVGLLSLVGLQNLWANSATFGANLFDYPSLLIWGLGANATTSGMAQLVKTWGFKTSIT